jgi:hypothetical protein
MEWAALIAWVATAGGGFVLLALWLKHGGMNQREHGRIRPPLILSHFLLAAAGLVVWIVYVVADKEVLAWIALAMLAVVALLGFTMFFVWLRERRTGVLAQAATTPATAAGGGAPAERRFPVAIVTVHGLLAVTTVVLVFLAAIDVGG